MFNYSTAASQGAEEHTVHGNTGMKTFYSLQKWKRISSSADLLGALLHHRVNIRNKLQEKNKAELCGL